MLNRAETGIVVAAMVGPLALIGALMLSSHQVPADPSPPIVVKPVPVYVSPPAPAGRRVISA